MLINGNLFKCSHPKTKLPLPPSVTLGVLELNIAMFTTYTWPFFIPYEAHTYFIRIQTHDHYRLRSLMSSKIWLTKTTGTDCENSANIFFFSLGPSTCELYVRSFPHLPNSQAPIFSMYMYEHQGSTNNKTSLQLLNRSWAFYGLHTYRYMCLKHISKLIFQEDSNFFPGILDTFNNVHKCIMFTSRHGRGGGIFSI